MHQDCEKKMKLLILNILIILKICLATKEEINTIKNEESCTEGAKKLSSKEKESCGAVRRSKSKKFYAELKETIFKIKESCGDVCNREITGKPSKFYDYIEKNFDCKALFENDLFDRESEFKEGIPHKIPKFMVNEYTYDGKIELQNNFRDDSEGTTHVIEWNSWFLDDQTESFKAGFQTGMYGKNTVYAIAETLQKINILKDKKVLVIGSQHPWIETMILTLGAKHVTTVDYEYIKSGWENITTMTNDVFNRRYLEGSLPQFEVMITFSSLEHSGLGRYGDALNPWGDLIAMARAWCVMKPGGIAVVGVPTGPTDYVVFNSHRVYGPLQFSHLFANFEQVDTNCDLKWYNPEHNHSYQPLYILRKPE